MELGVVTTVSITNPDVGDLMLGDDGDEVVLSTLAAETAQRLRVRLEFFKGEWFLDLRAGTPWYQRVFQKAPTDRVIRSVLSQVIAGTEGVASLERLSYTISRTRQMAVTFEAKLEDGTTFSSRDYAPFVVFTS